MNWESMLRLMKNPLFREFADLVIQNRDIVSDAARKWGGKKTRPEEQSAAGFDPAAKAEPAEPPKTPREDLSERLIALETAVAEARAAAEMSRSDVDEARSKVDEFEARVRAVTASSETLVRRLDALEIRTGSLDTALHQAVSRINTLEAEAVKRTRRFAFGAAALAGWSIVAALAIHLLLR